MSYSSNIHADYLPSGITLPLDAIPCMSPCSWDHLMTLCLGSLAYGL